MQQLEVDVAILGAGSAGMMAYRSASNEGKRVVLIEGGEFGTMCARVGCMPSKLLIAAAESAHWGKRAEVFGVHYQPPQIDGQAVMARVRAERDRFVSYTLKDIDAMLPEEILVGWARFVGPDTLNVDDQVQVKASAWVIATGSSPRIPEGLEALGDRLVVNDDIFDWTDLPSSVAVLGTGVIALELGQALSRLGVKVTLLGRRQQVGPLSDPELVNLSRKLFADGMDVRLDTEIVSAQATNEGVQLRLNTGGVESTLAANFLLVAAGRTPNVRGLGLDHQDVTLDRDGIPLFDVQTMQCGRTNVFLAGDVTGALPTQHEAADEGRIAGRNAARFPQVAPSHRRCPLSIVFTDPQMAIVGARFSALEPGAFVMGRASFENQGRSRIMAVNRGAMSLYAETGSGLFLGAEIIGPAAEHLGHLLAWACQQELTINDMLALPYYHPVIEEAVRSALSDCRKALIRSMPLDSGMEGVTS